MTRHNHRRVFKSVLKRNPTRRRSPRDATSAASSPTASPSASPSSPPPCASPSSPARSPALYSDGVRPRLIPEPARPFFRPPPSPHHPVPSPPPTRSARLNTTLALEPSFSPPPPPLASRSAPSRRCSWRTSRRPARTHPEPVRPSSFSQLPKRKRRVSPTLTMMESLAHNTPRSGSLWYLHTSPPGYRFSKAQSKRSPVEASIAS